MILASLSFSVFHSIERNTEKLKLVVIRRLGQTYEVPPRARKLEQIQMSFPDIFCVISQKQRAKIRRICFSRPERKFLGRSFINNPDNFQT